MFFRRIGFWIFAGPAALSSGCGKTQTVSVPYADSTAGKTDPDYIVYIASDLQSNFSQGVTPAEEPTGNGNEKIPVYFYPDPPDNLKLCALFQRQVQQTSGYHSGTGTESNCTALASSLTVSSRGRSQFPIPESYARDSGRKVEMSPEGFVYAFFFYNSTATSTGSGSVGTSIAANAVVPAGNRCFKLWAGRVSASVVQILGSDGSLASSVDLKGLKCYGF